MIRRSTHCSAQGMAGFTLMELLVAMTLLGLVMVLLTGGIRFGARVWERSEAQGSHTDTIRVAQEFLRRQLSRAYPLFVTDPTNPHVEFSGNEDSMALLTTAPQAFSQPGRIRLRIASTKNANSADLIIAMQDELAKNDSFGETQTLVRGFESLSFSYFGTLPRDKEPSWHHDWTDARTFPLLIRVEGRFPLGDERKWPDLVVAPRINADAACIYDALTQYCQGRS